MSEQSKIIYSQKLSFSTAEFALIFNKNDNQFTTDYYKHIKNAVGKRSGYNVVCNKKYAGAKTLTVSFNCAKYIGDNKCLSSGSLSLKKVNMYRESVEFDLVANCLHYDGMLNSLEFF